MQPSPRADTSRLLFPSLRFCIVSPQSSLRFYSVTHRRMRLLLIRTGGRHSKQGDLKIEAVRTWYSHWPNSPALSEAHPNVPESCLHDPAGKYQCPPNRYRPAIPEGSVRFSSAMTRLK